MDLRKACQEYGFTPGGLEDRSLAPSLLGKVERVSRASVPELKHEIRKRGFATPGGMAKDDLVQRLRDILLWESFRLGELRRVCREHQLLQSLGPDVEQTRETLLQLLADATWQARGIPSWRLPSLILAFGVLDQVDSLEAKPVEDLVWMCEKRGLPIEDPPEQEILAERLRTVVVWEHLPLEELHRECQVMGVLVDDLAPPEAGALGEARPAPLSSGGAGAGFMFRGDAPGAAAAGAGCRDGKRELLRRLTDLFWQAPPPPPAGGLLPEDDPRYAEQVAMYLEVLQLPHTAGSEELRKAYRDLARKHHPDKNLGAEEQVTAEFQAISEAYEALSEYMRRHSL